MACDYIIAMHLIAADECALNAGWKRITHNLWETPGGRQVRYLALERHAAGIKPPSVLYLGRGWQFNDGAKAIMAYASTRQMEFRQMSWTPLKGEREKKS